MKARPRQTGQAIAEALVTLPLLVLSLTALLSLGYRGLVFYLADYHLHESLICLDDDSAGTCKKNLERKIKSFMFFEKHFRVEMTKSRNLGKGSVSIGLKPPLVIRKEMSFPLKASR